MKHTHRAPRGKRAALLATIIGGRQAWTSARTLHRRGYPAGVLIRLAARGWVVRWDRARDGRRLKTICWTLTPWAAARLGVEIVEEGPHHRPRWAPIGSDPEPLHADRQTRTTNIRFPELIPDHRPQYLVDVDTGETSEDPAQAQRLWGRPIQRAKAAPKPRRPGSRPGAHNRRAWVLKYVAPYLPPEAAGAGP